MLKLFTLEIRLFVPLLLSQHNPFLLDHVAHHSLWSSTIMRMNTWSHSCSSPPSLLLVLLLVLFNYCVFTSRLPPYCHTFECCWCWWCWLILILQFSFIHIHKNTSFLFYSFCITICWTIYAMILVVAGRGRERRVLPFVVVTEDAGCCRSSLRKEWHTMLCLGWWTSYYPPPSFGVSWCLCQEDE